MTALHESLVEWTALALGVAVTTAWLARLRRPTRLPSWPRYWLPGVALTVIVANAGIAVNAAFAAVTGTPAASVSAGGMTAAMAGALGALGADAGDGAAAVRIGAVAASACLAALLVVWLYLSRSLRVLPSPAMEDDVEECCTDCPQCIEAGIQPPAEGQKRRRARGLTMTRLGGG